MDRIPGYFGVMALAAEYAHRNNNQSTAQILQYDEACEDSGTMGRRRTHAGTQRRSHLAEYGGRAEQGPFETWVVYVDYHAMLRAQLSETDFSAFIAPGSIASDYVGLFGHEAG